MFECQKSLSQFVSIHNMVSTDMPTFSPTSQRIEDYIEELENFMLAHHGECDDARKKAAIMTAIGAEGKAVIGNFTGDQKATYNSLCRALREHYKVQKHTFVERHTFFSMFMEEDEPVDNYVTRLRTQALKCDFRVVCRPYRAAQPANPATAQEAVAEQPAVYHEQIDEFIRDRLIVSIRDNATRSRLMRQETLTLEDVITSIKATEVANREMKRLMEEQSTNGLSVHQIASNKFKTPAATPLLDRNKPQKNGRGEEQYLCTKYCGQWHVAGRCPAYGQSCNLCGKANHFARVCRSKTNKKQSTNTVSNIDLRSSHSRDTAPSFEDDTRSESELFLGMVSCDLRRVESNQRVTQSNSNSNWTEKLELNGKIIECKIDTGAQANVMSHNTFKSSFNDIDIVQCNIKLKAYNGTHIPCLGYVYLDFKSSDTKHKLQFFIVPIKVATVLGLASCIDLKFVTPTSSITTTTTNTVTNRQVRSVSQTNMTEQCDSGESTTNSLFSGEFKTVFDNTSVGQIKGEPYDIKLKQDAVPVVDIQRTTPFAILDKVTAEIRRMESLGVIVKVNEPTEWVNSMVVVQRGDKLRICLDPTSLNKYIRREHIQLPTTDEMLARIGKARVFSKLDLKDGYWHVPLTTEASFLTTFNSPIGRWRYTRLPFGINSANEVFQKKVSQHFEDIPGAMVLFDDILVYAENEEDHDRTLQRVLKRCESGGIKLNQKKCEFKMKEVKYLGHIISEEGIKIDPEKVADIINMPQPEDRAGVQRLLGSLNYLAKFIPNLSTMTHPIRQLLNKKSVFQWTFEHGKAMTEIKKCLTTAPVLGFYDVTQDVKITCDSSGTGIGGCLLQSGRPIAYASRSLSENEQSYAQIEKEMLAIVFCCERFYQFLYGKTVTCETDHQPLITVFKRQFHSNPVRLQRFLLRLQRYDLNVNFTPGKNLHLADMLSRAPALRQLTDTERELEKECTLMISTIIRHLNCSDDMKNKIIIETDSDLCLRQVKFYILNGWPQDAKTCHLNAKAYWSDRASLSFQDGMLLFQDRIVIPKSLQAEILERIHEGHQGQERCKMLARKSVYWRGITADIERVVSSCSECLERPRAPQREPLLPHTLPDAPWLKVASDIFSYGGQKYQIVVDYFSKWVEVEHIPVNPKSNDVIKHLKSLFSRFGIPEELVSDGDPLYTSLEFNRFCKTYEFNHTFSSAGYARSNGQVERKIAFVKDLIAKCEPNQLDMALLQYRNTPLSGTLGSPASILFGRNLRTRMPMLHRNLVDERDINNRMLLEERQNVSKMYHDRTATKQHKQFDSGDLVRYRDNLVFDKKWKEGQITKPVNTRSYELVNSLGNVLRRNRRLLTRDSSRRSMPADPGEYIVEPHPLARDNRHPVIVTPRPAPALSPAAETPPAPGISDKPPRTNPTLVPLRRSERIRNRDLKNASARNVQ